MGSYIQTGCGCSNYCWQKFLAVSIEVSITMENVQSDNKWHLHRMLLSIISEQERQI